MNSQYYHKYLKYKIKYLNLTDVNYYGGGKPKSIEKVMNKANIPGLSLVVLKKNKMNIFNLGLSNNRSNKKITNKTVYLSASLSKPVFSFGVLKLVEDGRLDLDKPLVTYMDVNKIDGRLKKDKRYKKITARMVLSHTSGLQNDGSNEILFDPGQKFLYSGDAFIYLQHVIEHITKMSINDYMLDKVFRPFGMDNSKFIYQTEYNNRVITPHDHLGKVMVWGKDVNPLPSKIQNAYVAGSLFSTAEDYGKFLVGLSKNKFVREHMVKEQIDINKDIYWGLGVGGERVGKDRLIWHWGDNLYFRHFVLFDPINGNGFVLYTNSYNGLSIIDHLSKLFYNKKFKSVLVLKGLTEGRYLHEQYDNPLRINRLSVLNEFIKNGVEQGVKKYKKWIYELDKENRDQIYTLLDEFNSWLYPKNKKFIEAILDIPNWSGAKV